MACKFRWIHFSDIHFQTKDVSFNTALLQKNLPLKLKDIDENIDAMIISGDFRYAPSGDENPKSIVDYIKSLASNLNLKNSQIVTLPGNHDLKRSYVRDAVLGRVQSDYKPDEGTIKADALENLLKDFSFYNSVNSQLGDATSWEKNNPHCIVEFKNCYLLILNTALTAGTDYDNGKLILGSKYIESILVNLDDNKPIIAVGHHSFTEMESNENKAITHYLEQKGVFLYLCGHSHDNWYRGFGENGKEVTVGCMMQANNSVRVGFEIGELNDQGGVVITFYKWDIDQKVWIEDLALKREFPSLYSFMQEEEKSKDSKSKVEKIEAPFSIKGYTLLGSRGIDGIKYYWNKNDSYVESIAFNKRLVEPISENDNETSAYTISTSFGCFLSTIGRQCKFCETGAQNFKGLFRAEDIALQCIFMAEYDSNCLSYPQVRNNYREFAFMGQGEPGYNYAAIRQAIIMTDFAMERLGQKVSRYIISTCGVLPFISLLMKDIKEGVFKNPVTLHLSLHDIDKSRDKLMPINLDFDYKEVIEHCKALYKITGVKIGVGILMFYEYETTQKEIYNLSTDKLEGILGTLDKDVFRIDLCSVNDTNVGKQKHSLSNENATKLYDAVINKGFECKMFSSFGQKQQSGCGMLNSSIDDMEEAGSTTITHFNNAVKLLNEAKEYYIKSL